jgi:hypothetical protein
VSGTLLALLLATSTLSQATQSRPVTQADEVKAALNDAQRLGAAATRTRYLSLAAAPNRDRETWVKVVSFWANSLSREADVTAPRRVSPTLLAVVIDDYSWDAATWEKLAEEDPYYHVQISQEVAVWQGGVWPGDGKYYPPGAFTHQTGKQVRKAALAPWLPLQETADLVALTQSQAPIVRGDWWFVRSAIQVGRKGTGYYDWLGGLKDRKDFEKLVSLNVAESQRIKREVAAIVARSGVSYNPRQIFRFQSLTGGYWVTRDALTDNRDERNALRQLDGEFKHEAEEHYGVLPNGLFAYYLSDAKGTRQDSAPDTIGPDDSAVGKDKRIHVGLSCVRCHVEGLRPIDDWGRKVFRDGLALSSSDAVKARRLKQLYLSELSDHLDSDVAANARAVKRLTGWTQAEAAAAIGKAWAWYVERDLSPGDAARELGVSEAEYLEALAKAAKSNPLFDAVLASHLAKPPVPIRSDDWEQVYPLAADYVRVK